MIQFFCMFFPSILSTTLYRHMKKTNLGLLDYVLAYCWFTILTNYLAFIILSRFLNYKYIVYSSFQVSGIYALKYVVISMVLTGIILTVLYLIQILEMYLSSKKGIDLQEIKKKSTTVLLAIVGWLIILLAFFLYFTPGWIQDNFSNVSVEQIVFHMNVSLKGVNTDYIKSLIKDIFLPSGILTTALIVIFNILNGVQTLHKEKSHLNGQNPLSPLHISEKRILILAVVLFILVLQHTSKSLNIGEYISYAFTNSNFIEINYVDPLKTNITFPEKKRNLIYIFLESMENTYLNKDLGGVQQTNLIPELSALSENNTNFSNTAKIGGAIQLSGTQWTIGAMVAQNAGLPLKLPILNVNNNTYGDYRTFLPGGISLGDILEKEGYQQMLMIGSEAYFGGRLNFYAQHGNYQIFDYDTAKERTLIPEDYYEWWGFEDQKLFQFAKEELLKLAESEAPFNFTMLTADTHNNDGYLCQACENQHETQYANVISCSSQQVGAFVKWIQAQDFYENTTIVISGDHLSMDINFFTDLDKNYLRTTYNVFINPAIQTDHTKNRLFSTVDLFPTTLASIGVLIDGDRLGLGTNLFSNTPTLLETYGFTKVEDGFRFKSNFYNHTFIFKRLKNEK